MLVIKSFAELGRFPQVGDRVKIVDTRSGVHWNRDGDMDHHLGAVMTVENVNTDHLYEWTVYLKESRGEHGYSGWTWYPWMIEGAVIETIEDILDDPSTWAFGDALDALLT